MSTQEMNAALVVITVIFVILILGWIIAVIYMKKTSKGLYKTYVQPPLENGYYPGGGLMPPDQLAAYQAALQAAVAAQS